MLSRAALVPLACALLSGCASGTAYFAPTQTQVRRASGEVVASRYMVPVEAGHANLLLHTEARAFKDSIGEGIDLPTLQVRYWIHNDSAVRLELRLSEFTAVDDSGRELRFSRGVYRRELTTVVICQPRTRATADVYFHLPPGYDVKEPKGMTIQWSLRVGDGEYRQTTAFERSSGLSFHDPFLQLPLRGG
ncbi:hypothetical protein ACFL59_04015 [Planctomycetota bacterium]